MDVSKITTIVLLEQFGISNLFIKIGLDKNENPY